MTDAAATTEPTLLELTPDAAAEVKSLSAQPDNAGKFLRVYVEQGGCSGMQYGLVFDERREGDRVCEQNGVTVLIDAFSAQYLGGSRMDFSDAMTGGGFKLVNPNAKQSCGCGKSFQA